MRVIFQVGIWLTATFGNFEVPSPNDWGSENNDGHCRPRWITQQKVADTACSELTKCICLSGHGCTRCKCNKPGLPCTDLCKCIKREIDVSSLSKLTEHTLSVNRYDCVMGMEGMCVCARVYTMCPKACIHYYMELKTQMYKIIGCLLTWL